MIEKFVNKFTDYRVPDVVKIWKQYYQLRPELKGLVEQIEKNMNRQPFSAGLFLGEEKGREFKPSLALMDIIGKHTDQLVVVDDKAEWLFLCGRDVFSKSVVKSNVDRGIVIVMNKKKEVLGYGMVDGDLKRKEKVYVKNVLDRGDFLRREMRKRK